MSFDTPLPPFNASDPHATFLSSSCLDFLLIELVPLATRLAHELSVRVPGGSSSGAHYHQRHGSSSSGSGNGTGSRIRKDGSGGVGNNDDGGDDENGNERSQIQRQSQQQQRHRQQMIFEPLDEEEEREAVFYRLEMLGYRVGIGLVERFSRDKARMNDTLDVIKFVCKDLWTIVFRKQIDNLKTNHRGVYVLTDNSFRPFSRMSTEAGGATVLRAQPFLWFPCGIIRGALANMGVNASVQAETTDLPAAVFKIETLQKPI